MAFDNYSQAKADNHGKLANAEETSGKLSLGEPDDEDKLMHSVLSGDKDAVDDGRLISDAINNGFGLFTPELLMEQLVKNFSITRKLLGDSLLRQLTGYEPDYLARNIKVPEFRLELEKILATRIERLKDSGLIDNEGEITDKGLELAALILYKEELDRLKPEGILGEKVHKKKSEEGLKDDIKDYKNERYRNIAIRKSIKRAVRRGHDKIIFEDLVAFEPKSKGQCYVIYALDASGSMKGGKLEQCKKAGIALAYKAIDEKNLVGLMVFGHDVKASVEPTKDFTKILREIARVRASRETNIAGTITEALKMFPKSDVTRHLMLITDAMPTAGEKPVEDTLEAAALARKQGITISVIGIELNARGIETAEKIAELGNGRMYKASKKDDIDYIVLEDYYSVV